MRNLTVDRFVCSGGPSPMPLRSCSPDSSAFRNRRDSRRQIPIGITSAGGQRTFTIGGGANLSVEYSLPLAPGLSEGMYFVEGLTRPAGRSSNLRRQVRPESRLRPLRKDVREGK